MQAALTTIIKVFDESVFSAFTEAGKAISGWAIPVGYTMLALSILVYALLVMEGKVDSPLSEWIKKIFLVLLILQFAGSQYEPWVAKPLYGLGEEMAKAVVGGKSPTSSIDMLFVRLAEFCSGVFSAMIGQIADMNIGQGILLGLCGLGCAVAGAFLLIMSVLNILFAKAGVALLLSIGPIVITAAIWSPLRPWFFSWLGSVMYFSVLSVVTVIMVTVATKIGLRFMSKLEVMMVQVQSSGGFVGSVDRWLQGAMGIGDTAAPDAVAVTGNVVVLMLQLNITFFILALLVVESRGIVQSVFHGAGASAGATIVSSAQTLKNLLSKNKPTKG